MKNTIKILCLGMALLAGTTNFSSTVYANECEKCQTACGQLARIGVSNCDCVKVCPGK